MKTETKLKIILVGTVLSTLHKVGQVQATPGVQALGSKYNDCEDMINLVDCTDCYSMSRANNGGIQRFPFSDEQLVDTAVDFELVTCAFVGECPDGVLRNSCNWRRYFGYSCFTQTSLQNTPLASLETNAIMQLILAGGLTGYTVGTNSLPNHCYYSDHNAPRGSEVTFNFYSMTGVFNPNVLWNDVYLTNSFGGEAEIDYIYMNVNDQTDIDNLLCDHTWAKSTTLPSASLYTQSYTQYTYPAGVRTAVLDDWEPNVNNFPFLRMPDSNAIVGVALNGVFFFAGSSHYGYDAFFPKAYGARVNPKKLEVDVCLGNVDTYSTYRYHMFSPCIYDIALRTQAMDCKNHEICSVDVRNHSQAYIPPQLRTLDPVGIAKDGRIIYGPYRQDGNLWQPCDVDMCNGHKFSRLNYGYVSTMFHPYIVGCWGPGARPVKMYASCSSNGRYCTSGSYLFSSLIVVFGAVIFSFFN